MAENNDLQHKLVNDVYAELGTVSKHSQDVIDYLMRHGWIRTPEEAEAAARGQMPGRTITESELADASRLRRNVHGWDDRKLVEHLGITVVQDPEQTNIEKLTSLFDKFDEYSGPRFGHMKLAHFLDEQGVRVIDDE